MSFNSLLLLCGYFLKKGFDIFGTLDVVPQDFREPTQCRPCVIVAASTTWAVNIRLDT